MKHLVYFFICFFTPFAFYGAPILPDDFQETCKKIEKKFGKFTLIFMAPQTGELLFSYHKENINEKYAIGSLIKPFSYLSAASKHRFEPEKTYFCKGFKEYSSDKICWLGNGHGETNLVSGFANSCNSFFYDEIVKPHLTQTVFLQTLKNFQIDFYVKEEGLLDENFYRLAIGLDGYFIATPYSILKAYNSFYNGGLFFNEKKEVLKTLSIPAIELDIIRQGMRGAYLFGTANLVYQKLKIEDFAAKTGTGTAGKGGVITRKTSGWIVLFYPSEKPEISLLVMTEEGRGGKETAEIASEILKNVILK